jgi:hypothetical protein
MLRATPASSKGDGESVTNESTASPGPSAPRPSDGALWASMFVLAGLLIVQLTRAGLGVGATAKADVVSSVDKYTVLTFNTGTDDAVAVLDSSGEELFIYQVKKNDRLDFAGRQNLRDLFTTAKMGGSPGRGR